MPKINPDHPPTKTPQTKPSAKVGKRGRRTKPVGIAMPHKGSVRGRKPTLGQQYPRQ